MPDALIREEPVVEIPGGPDVDRGVREIRRRMIEGMRRIIPDLRVEVEPFGSTSRIQQAGPEIESQGRRIRVGSRRGDGHGQG